MRIGPTFFRQHFKKKNIFSFVKFMTTKKGLTTNFFHPSLLLLFWIRDLNFCMYPAQRNHYSRSYSLYFFPSLFYLVLHFTFKDVVVPVRPPDISSEDDSGFTLSYITVRGAVHGSLIDGTCFITQVRRKDKRSFVCRSDMWWCTIVQ